MKNPNQESLIQHLSQLYIRSDQRPLFIAVALDQTGTFLQGLFSITPPDSPLGQALASTHNLTPQERAKLIKSAITQSAKQPGEEGNTNC